MFVWMSMRKTAQRLTLNFLFVCCEISLALDSIPPRLPLATCGHLLMRLASELPQEGHSCLKQHDTQLQAQIGHRSCFAPRFQAPLVTNRDLHRDHPPHPGRRRHLGVDLVEEPIPRRCRCLSYDGPLSASLLRRGCCVLDDDAFIDPTIKPMLRGRTT